MATYDIGKAIQAQQQYCEKNGLPQFTPDNGRCWSCGQNIYEEKGCCIYGSKERSGISVERAGSQLITGCPFCNRSYCD